MSGRCAGKKKYFLAVFGSTIKFSKKKINNHTWNVCIQARKRNFVCFYSENDSRAAKSITFRLGAKLNKF